MTPNPYSQGIKEGWYVYFQKKAYCITELEEGGKIVIQNVDNPGDIRLTSIAAIVKDDPGKSENKGENDEWVVLFAPNLETLYAKLASNTPLLESSETLKIPPNLEERAKEIVHIIETVDQYLEEAYQRALAAGRPQDYRKKTALPEALDRLSPELKIAKTQYYYNLKLYKKHNGIVKRIAAALHRNTKGKIKIAKRILHFCDTVILQYYVRSKAISKTQAFEELCKIWRRTQGFWIDPDKCKGSIPNELVDQLLDPKISIELILENPEKAALLTRTKLPSKSWFIKYVKWFEAHPERGQAVIIQRYGKEYWENYYQVFDSFVNKAAYPRHYVVLDHWLIDVFSVDENDPTKVFRLWVTMAIDVWSRAIMSFTLSTEYPNIETVQENLLHMIWPKNPLEEIGVEGDWAAYGIALTLSLDNNWAHHSHSLEALARDISQKGKYDAIILLWRPPYKARYGNVIERLFGNLSIKIKAKFTGAGAILSSNPKDVGLAKDEAVFTPKDVYVFVYKEILKYMHTPHSGLGGMTPHEKLLEGYRTFGEPIVPPLTARMKRYFLRVHPEPKTIGEKGIGIFGMHYIGPELSFIESIDPVTGHKIEFTVRYTKKDISIISLFRDDTFIAELKARERLNPDGSVRPLSWAEHELAKERAKAKGKGSGKWLEEVDELDDTTAVEELREIRKKEKQKFMKNRKKSTNGSVPKASDVAKTEKAISKIDANANKNDPNSLIRGFLKKD